MWQLPFLSPQTSVKKIIKFFEVCVWPLNALWSTLLTYSGDSSTRHLKHRYSEVKEHVTSINCSSNGESQVEEAGDVPHGQQPPRRCGSSTVCRGEEFLSYTLPSGSSKCQVTTLSKSYFLLIPRRIQLIIFPYCISAHGGKKGGKKKEREIQCLSGWVMQYGGHLSKADSCRISSNQAPLQSDYTSQVFLPSKT